MEKWNTSPVKQTELSKMLDEWAVYIRRECEHKQLSSSIYLSKAEPFLEEYAKRSPENQALIGYAGNMIRAEDFLAILERSRDEESDHDKERDVAPSIPSPSVKDTVHKDEGLVIFFPGIPGCAKSALCKEILNASGCLEDDRPVHSLMGDLIKGRYWFKVSEERRKKPYSIILADKNAPNVEVWIQIEEMCCRTNASAVPVVPDSKEWNPLKGHTPTEGARWEKQLREILFRNADYLNSIQDPFELAVTKVLEQLKIIAKGDYTTPGTEKRKFGTIVFAAINLPTTEVRNFLANLEEKYPKIGEFLKDKNMVDSLRRAHVTLAHKRDHCVTAVANYGPFINQNVPVDISALFFSDKLVAFEAHPGSVDGEKIKSKNEWPHMAILLYGQLKEYQPCKLIHCHNRI